MSAPRASYPLDVSFLTWFNLGVDQPLLDAALAALQHDRAVQRIWGRDGSLWGRDPGAIRDIEERFGWRRPAGDDVAPPGISAPGGSRGVRRGDRSGGAPGVWVARSLAPEVMEGILGAAPGYPQLTVLDSTDPTQIRQATASAPLAHTIFLVASKSGGTVETDALLAHYHAAVAAQVGEERWARHFVAITDPGAGLEKMARAAGFRAVYANPPDVGGRFSALSFFGLVPAALIGVDLERLLARGQEMADARHVEGPAGNPGLLLGAIMGGLARHHGGARDKLTLFSSPDGPFWGLGRAARR